MINDYIGKSTWVSDFEIRGEAKGEGVISGLRGTGEAEFIPGNGTRYHLYYGTIPDMNGREHAKYFFCAWLRDGGSGGTIMRCAVGGFNHYSYVREKMRLDSVEDAKAIAHFMNSVNNDNYNAEYSGDLPRGIKKKKEAQSS